MIKVELGSPLTLQLQATIDGLLSELSLGQGEQAWSAEAEVTLTEVERLSLLSAVGLKAGDGEQPLSAHLLQALGKHGILSLTLLPPAPMDAARLAATTIRRGRASRAGTGANRWLLTWPLLVADAVGPGRRLLTRLRIAL